ncbi:tRNA (adenosine(37)-N6)-threonylcarbamoyltransferase complex dimerization subunit type 1 TsaB [Streptomyces alkaliterrae]|uniref:tRNA (Adenosine(37)-N6)-threonylcarbamoyltransferase complex dimerization subunit type 1 TsaB n=1 Tax=Streptomyces alkaliterrae TaxID=2213162 RepID=A0A5P0YMH1_9ACTN|nr:tRNA (adenosine(37)-N6)-threonylcarbamoyltransferase complex dimerization subunit type 1 TsaB [Streptomyces alkaliterrae]MBB1254142.1 tRNA (adenosine(37)-N6)-threonylcarbamoyltransferase complex dimerization subunit type 1 TsaB [Streptomyces alkaliterrae]MBB1260034.1 tRNA (adenosine(37)-N6)-threonylcarbamoyltransferase complex dimerization subunit type 1 TsaB [Streptomyces alkaliterrae]MQS01505.1 tRNA (adenosine(37)-N6)-threonylcarbamoyltransferase complex dimerization subunit type 1 TsaB [St
MLLLALDTATPAVTAALHDGERVLAAADQIDARRHGELLMPAVERVFRESGRARREVTGVVVGVGPGPYTGLRVGLATAGALGAALDVPVHGLCTLDGLAYAAGLDEPFVVATDARRKEVYWAAYDNHRSRRGEPSVDRAADLPADVTDLPAFGAGAVLYADAFPRLRPELPQHQSAAALASLAAERSASGEELLPPLPLYLRRPDAKVPAGYKVVTPR